MKRALFTWAVIIVFSLALTVVRVPQPFNALFGIVFGGLLGLGGYSVIPARNPK